MRNWQTYLTILIFILIIIIPPFLINSLLNSGINETWVSFLGSYIGSMISGFITFLGVLLTLKFTKRENDKDRLPDKIQNLHKCLDLLEKYLKEIEFLKREDFSETLVKQIHEWSLKLFHINKNFILESNDCEENLRFNYPKELRDLLSNVNAQAYDYSRYFIKDLYGNYTIYISPLETELSTFAADVNGLYMDSDLEIIINGNLSDVKLIDEDEEKLKNIKAELVFKEREYIQALYNSYFDLKVELKKMIDDLTIQMDY
ncbi:hypothetical protein AB4672_05065 [Bacillus paralicheniformis]|uniref:hypothetical protein n=1 Tax=Bacillus paralicheniformis TaxID=1648923 RepID=UPI0034D2D408